MCDIENLCANDVKALAREKFLVLKSLKPHPGDFHVGQRDAVPRKLLKLSQADFASHIGYSRQPVQWDEPVNVG